MLIYIIPIITAVIGSFLNNKLGRVLAYATFLYLFILTACRNPTIGTDSVHYIDIYESTTLYEGFKSEYLFYLLLIILNSFQLPSDYLLFVFAVITYIPYYIIVFKKSNNPSFSILLFVICQSWYFLQTFNILRQSVAIPLLLLSYIYLDEGNKVKSYITFIVSVGFHTSSLVFAPILLLVQKYKFDYKAIYATLIISFLWALSFSNINILGEILSQVGKLTGLSLFEKYSTYELSAQRNLFGVITMIFPQTIFCLMTYRICQNNLLMRIFVLGCIIMNFFAIMPFSYRMCMGISVIEIILVPYVFVHYRKLRLKCILVIGLIFIYFLLSAKSIEAGDFLPYEINYLLLV